MLDDPMSGQIYEFNGKEWHVYLEEVPVLCVRLWRFDPETKTNVFKNVPIEEFRIVE
jgi:hypothetical protein